MAVNPLMAGALIILFVTFGSSQGWWTAPDQSRQGAPESPVPNEPNRERELTRH